MKNLLLILFVASFFLGISCSQQRPIKIPMTNGHRGANVIAPENTLASADSCIKYGIDYMECDVCISKDSVFYLLHDSLLDRTTNGKGNINQWMSADIDTLDAGFWFGPEFKGLHVPRFADLLQKAKENGLKIAVDYRNGDLHKLLGLIRSKEMLENCNFTFGNEETAKQFRQIAPDVKTLQAYVRSEEDLDRVIREVNPNIAVIRIDLLTPEFVQECHQRGLEILALALGLEDQTVDNQKAVDLGVDAIATDYPELFVKKYGKSTRAISGQ